MSYETFIASRYLRSRKASRFLSTITVISIGGVAVGVTALIVVLSVMTGFEEQLRDKIIGMNAHGNVSREMGVFPDDPALVKTVASTEGVKLAAPYLMREVMVSSKSTVTGGLMKGINPELGSQVIQVKDMMTLENGGKWSYLTDGKALLEKCRADRDKEAELTGFKPSFDPFESAANKPLPPLILGKEMAEFLHSWTCDVVNVINPLGGGIGPTGPIPDSKPFRVAGVYYSGMFEYDMKIAFTPISDLQEFAGAQGSITGIEFTVPNDSILKTGQIGRRISDNINAGVDGTKFIVKDWMELNQSLFSALKVEQLAMFVILTFITVVAAFNIASTLIMMVIEKRREISILKSMGASDSGVMSIFQFDGLIIGLIGTALGTVLGLAACALIPVLNEHFELLDPSVYYMTQLPVHTRPGDLAAIVFSALLISWTATLYPSWRASRINPVDGLRNE